VTPVGGHGSHLIGDLAVADAVIVVPAETEVVHAESQVRVLLLDREF
jgi:molybdopterin molybdotransferase